MSENRLKCFNKLAESTQCEIVCITPENIHSYILPNHPLHPAYQYLSETHKSDYLRCYFMHFYGGGYTDIKLQGGSWIQAFDDMDKYGWMINGYPLTYDGHSVESCKHSWDKLIIGGAIICRSNTLLTQEWYTQLIQYMNENLEELKRNPATYPQAAKWDRRGYPIEWTGMVAIFQSLCLKYEDYIGRSVPPLNTDLHTYR
jgi:hypothetical protein